MTDANETAKEDAIKIPDVLPVLPLKDLVIFPFIIVPLSVSREKSINAVDQALAENRVIMLTAQKDFQNEDPAEDDLYRVGTVAIIIPSPSSCGCSSSPTGASASSFRD